MENQINLLQGFNRIWSW